MQAQWKGTESKDVAVVDGQLAEKKEISPHTCLRTRLMSSIPQLMSTKGKLAHTAYKALKETKQSSLLEINLSTGRKNQIRVHMADNGHPMEVIVNMVKPRMGTGVQRFIPNRFPSNIYQRSR